MGVDRKDFNSFGSRRGNDRVMARGTFANVRIKNLMVDGTGRRLYAVLRQPLHSRPGQENNLCRRSPRLHL